MTDSFDSLDYNCKELFKNLRDGVVTVDFNGRILGTNKAMERIIGYSEEELKKLTYNDITPEKWHDVEARIVQEQTLKRGYSDIYEKEYRKKDGTIIPVELNTYILRNDSGENLGLQAVIRDISERKVREENLRLSEEKFRLLFEYAPVGIALTSLEGHFVRTNLAFRNIFGYSDEELANLTIKDLTHPDDFNLTAINIALLKTGKKSSYQVEKRYIRKDGSIVWCKGFGAQVDHLRIGAIVDITDQKNALLNEQHAREEAERIIHMRDDFLSMASHELRTPLMPLLMGVELLKRLIDRTFLDRGKKEEFFSAIKKNEQHVRRMKRFVEIMLLTLRINTGQLKLNRETCDLSEVIRATVKDYQLDLDYAHSQVVIQSMPAVWGSWDRKLLQQAIGIFLENAMKFGVGRPIEIKLTAEQDVAKVTIRDHGTGLSKIEESRILNLFDRGEANQNYSGLGHELYIVKKIIEAHGGRVSCQNASHDGAVFCLELQCGPEQIRNYNHTQSMH